MICLALTSKHFASTIQNIGIDVPKMNPKGYKDHLCTLIQLRTWFPRKLSLCWMCGTYKEKAHGGQTWGFARTKAELRASKAQRQECRGCASGSRYRTVGGIKREKIRELTWLPQRKRSVRPYGWYW